MVGPKTEAEDQSEEARRASHVRVSGTELPFGRKATLLAGALDNHPAPLLQGHMDWIVAVLLADDNDPHRARVQHQIEVMTDMRKLALVKGTTAVRPFAHFRMGAPEMVATEDFGPKVRLQGCNSALRDGGFRAPRPYRHRRSVHTAGRS